MKKPILITGIHRSGTTWVGDILARKKEIVSFYEPFNPITSKNLLNIEINKHYLYLENSNNAISEFNQKTRNLVEFKLWKNYSSIFSHLLKTTHKKTAVKNILKSVYGNIFNKRILLKDPIAFFTTEWLHKEFQVKPVLLVRHPASFISSIIKNNWNFDFEMLLSQQRLMDGPLKLFKNDLLKIRDSNIELTIVEQGVLLWNMIYSHVIFLKNKYPEWLLVKHEDLCEKPLENFEKIFKYLNISFNEKIVNYIKKTTSGSNSERESNELHVLVRDSANLKDIWKTRLKKEEIRYIKNNTKGIFGFFYNESDWI